MLSQEPTSQYHNPACLFHFAMISTWYISPQLEGLASCYPPPPFFLHSLSFSGKGRDLSMLLCHSQVLQAVILEGKVTCVFIFGRSNSDRDSHFSPKLLKGLHILFQFFFTIPIIVKTMPKVPIMFATVGHISNFDWFSICEPDMVLLSLEKIRVKFVTCVYTSPNRWKHHTECTQVPINRIPLTCFSSQPAV